MYTCFVFNAKIIAIIGGNTDRNPYSINEILVGLKVLFKTKDCNDTGNKVAQL
jgi:hypothetical protein